jgi:predicted dehydrogenase
MRAAVIGLGKIGNTFDADPKRLGTWSHAGAYEKAEGVTLVAGADPDPAARETFLARRAGTSAYADFRELLAREQPEIVSICTTPDLHAEMVRGAVDAGARAVFCEKPLAETLADARDIVETCRRHGVTLAVNHTRRWDREWLWPKQIVASGRIGTVQTVTGWYYGGALNLGSHLMDTIHMVTGARAASANGGESRGTGDDFGVSGLVELKPAMTARVACADGVRDLWFEIELVGTEGRLRILDNGLSVELSRWAPSGRYSGYRELARAACANPLPPQDRFVDAVRDLVSCVADGGEPACSGADGYAALAAIVALKASAASGGARVPIVPMTQEEETV